MTDRTLILLRHGKSSWKSDAARDFDRPLSGRGVRDGGSFGAGLATRLPKPDLVLCSSARRTRDTLAFLIPSLVDPRRVRFEDDLYHASAEALITRLQDLPDGLRCVLLIGHNPGLTDLVHLLAGQGAQGLDNLPTFAVAEFAITSSFGALQPGAARLVDCFGPRGPLAQVANAQVANAHVAAQCRKQR